MGQARGGDGARRLGGPLQRGVRVRPARARRLRDRLPGTLACQRVRPLGVDRARLGPGRAARPPAVPDPAAAETVKRPGGIPRRFDPAGDETQRAAKRSGNCLAIAAASGSAITRMCAAAERMSAWAAGLPAAWASMTALRLVM